MNYNNIHNKYSSIPREKIYLFFVLFLLLLRYLFGSYFIFPLWDIPDESGHWSYIYSIYKNKSIFLKNEFLYNCCQNSLVASDYVHQNYYRSNWIIFNHPPLYYILGSPFVAIADLLSQNSKFIFLSTRLLSNLIMVLSHLYLYKIARFYLTPLLSIFFCIFPIYFIGIDHISFGTTNDVLVFFLVTLLIYFLIKFEITSSSTYITKSSIITGLLLITKYTVVPFILPLLSIYFCFFFFKKKYKLILQSTIIITLPFILYILLFYYNFEHLPEIIENKINPNPKEQINNLSVLEYIKYTPVISEILIHLFDQYNWVSSGIKRIDIYFSIYNAIFIYFLFFFSICLKFKNYFSISNLHFFYHFFLIILFLNIFLILYFIFIPKNLNVGNLNYFIYSSAFVSLIFFLLFNMLDIKSRFLNFSLSISSISMIFIFILILKDIYNYQGYRAIHGRYFIPIIISFYYLFIRNFRYFILKNSYFFIFVSILLLISSFIIFNYSVYENLLNT